MKIEQSYTHNLTSSDVAARIIEAFDMYRENHPDYQIELRWIVAERMATVKIFVPIVKREFLILVENQPPALKLSIDVDANSKNLVNMVLGKLGEEVRTWLE